MHFVYICREGTNEELRYSIRSVLQNVPGAEISVVGGKPDWYNGHYISVPQKKTKYLNGNANLTRILNSDEIPQDFILMNDDFFILKPMEEIPILHSGLLSDKLEKHYDLGILSGYTNNIKKTQQRLRRLKVKDPLDYSIHVPFHLNKDKFDDIFDPTKRDLLWRTIYGNVYKVGGEYTPDVKVYTRGSGRYKSYDWNEDSIFLSTDDYSFDDKYGVILQKMFKKRPDLELTPGQVLKNKRSV